MEYKVYRVIGYFPSYGLGALAVSASSPKRAWKRVVGFYPKSDHINLLEVPGRVPEYAQDRIEGTCDLRDLMAPAPPLDSERAKEIRASNKAIISREYVTP